MPNAHAQSTNDKFFTTATSTASACTTLCKTLSFTSGTLSTATAIGAAVEGSAPALDSGASSDKTGTWSAGTSISVASWATAQTPDTVLVIIAASLTATPIQNAPSTLPSGMTCDAAVRKEQAESAAHALSEWACHTTSTIASTTITCNLASTPTWGICEVIAINGAEDPTGTFSPFDQAGGTSGFVCTGNRNAGGGTAAPSTATGPSASCTSGLVTSLNANDLWIGIAQEIVTTTQTAGNLAGSAATFIHTTASTGSLSLERLATSATVSATVCGTFGVAVARFNIFCDALQAKPTFYKVEPETSATLSGTPSTTAFSGTGWVFDTAGGPSAELLDFQSGTWQFDMKNAVGSTTGSPVAHFFFTVWKCTTDTCSSPTLLFKDWDTGTNIAGATTQTAHSYTSASQAVFSSWSGNFLAYEVWVAWQYSGSTASTTVTMSTIDTSQDIIPPGIDYAKTTTATLTQVSKFSYDAVIAGKAEEIGTYIVGQATAFQIKAASTLTLVTTLGRIVGYLRTFAQTMAFTMSVLVTATQVSKSSQVITISNRATTVNITPSVTTASSLSRKLVLLRTVSATLTLSSGNPGRLVQYLRTFTSTLTLSSGNPGRLFQYLRTFTSTLTDVSSLLVTAKLNSNGQTITINNRATTINFASTITLVAAVTAVRGSSCPSTFCKNLSGTITLSAVESGLAKLNSNGQTITISGRATTANFASTVITVSSLSRQLVLLRTLTATVTQVMKEIVTWTPLARISTTCTYQAGVATACTTNPTGGVDFTGPTKSFFDNTVGFSSFSGLSLSSPSDCSNTNAICRGQFFTESGTTTVSSVNMAVCVLGGGPTGNVYAKIYAGSGTAPNGVGTGSVLATSGAVDVTTIPQSCAGSNALVTFTFSGANQITLTNGNTYVIAIAYDFTGGTGNPVEIFVGLASNNGNPAYNVASDAGGTWSANSADVMRMQLFGFTPVTPSITATKNSNGQVITISNRATTANFASTVTTVSTVSRQLALLRTVTGTLTLSTTLGRIFGYVRTFTASVVDSSLAQWSTTYPSAHNTVGVTTTCYSAPHTPTCFIFIDPSITFSTKFTYATATVSCSIVVLVQQCNATLNQSWNLQASLSRLIQRTVGLPATLTATSALSRQLVLQRNFPGSITTKASLAASCVIGNIAQCVFGGGNSALSKAAIGIAVIAIGLIIFVIYRQGGLSMRGNRGRYQR